MVLWVRFEIYDILSQWSHMITLERPMNYKSLVYGLSVKTFLFLPSLPWKVWEPFKVLLLPTTIRATIRALPSAHYHPRTYVNTEGVNWVQFPSSLGPAAQTQGNSPAVDRDRMAKVVQITYTRLDSLSLGDFWLIICFGFWARSPRNHVGNFLVS